METLEEFIKKSYLSRLEDCLKVDFEDGVKLGVKWQTDRMYSEEEVKNIIRTFDKEFYSGIVDRDGQTNKWFEQFKKK